MCLLLKKPSFYFENLIFWLQYSFITKKESRRSSQRGGGGGAHPLHFPPKSANEGNPQGKFTLA